MNDTPLFLKPVFQERIWGGTALYDRFGYEIPSAITGECWAISAHPNGLSLIENGKFQGKSLKEVWENHHELFGNYKSEKFPLLIKILDANEELSVQVHPNDDYANEHENGEYGKTECWYIIDCDQDAELVFGHHAKTKEEVREMIQSGNWERFLRKVTIRPGDFFYVPSGTVHALCNGTLVLETQQSSDTTYRVYDYDRVDNQGSKRELHLEKAMGVINAPHIDTNIAPEIEKREGVEVTKFVQNHFFSVNKWDVNGEAAFQQNQAFMLVSIIDGEGRLLKGSEDYTIRKGAHFILPYKYGEFILKGNMKLIVSHL
ncbi:mannose-6-phosphate isomerase, class I [Peribacillus butanolivorans]|uniref:Mannose-6-phosphate isomerase n=1 Tax=Peribacillus butanolivorans TaxID=421767 RepID=A0ABN5N7S8_9BACI|nr:mannose-6-phosphate isomerase, class I [Peribacillus butanolivorans]AXN39162.1 mannose-6-phosphate isomerase, class I [Peribacillus butanolivorans]